MNTFAFLLFIGLDVSAAYVSNNCDERKCEDISPFEDIGNIEFLPNKEQLSRICPLRCKCGLCFEIY
ncbi:hypothetical protein NPIL_492461 [Nephila pilipes]|uniref:Spider venom protein n=1 Tax=Nephila pilipes TaxID=299642 RepID=A0A8X6MIN8_NEPPI|nr:hypothetical protein NPIL_492461 [Nephila pilipes]